MIAARQGRPTMMIIDRWLAVLTPIATSSDLTMTAENAPPSDVYRLTIGQQHLLITHRQLIVLLLYLTGKTINQIARFLGAAQSSVRIHIKKVLRRLHCANRDDLLTLLKQHNLINASH